METAMTITEWVREELVKQADITYREFHKSLVPGLTSMIGVRVPKMREIAKKAAKEDYWDFAEKANPSVYEEILIRGMMIGYAKLTFEEQQAELVRFVPGIQNWAVCDCSCATYKFMKKDQEAWFAFLKTYAESSREFEVRFAVVCMLDFFVNESFIERILEVFAEIRQEGYYVKMAVAWAVSVCYVKFPGQTERLLKEQLLDVFTHNKSIQKIRESYRVAQEDKDRLNTWKRKETDHESSQKRHY